ncbi:MAG: phytanoyl-CoA dioxygenase family protein [Planctomycetota bacterium]|nr:phytanoyl-CoA dioxygenase family protein [Planctomycetota bacterium]
MSLVLTPAQIDAFHRDGYLIVPRLFSGPLVEMLLKIARNDPVFVGKAGIMKDAKGGESKIAITMQLTRNIYGAFVHSDKIVPPTEQLLGGPVYHLHHKMMVKEPIVGGAWEWHQDYGYWYNDGFLAPDLASCMIAVDRASKANGCLQVLKGSHLLGRIEHGRFGDQVGANPERVAEIAKRLELVYVEMEPGSAVFFHCNTLHRSDPNTSPDPRWSLICCYSKSSNQPYRPSHAPYAPLEVWDDQRILEVANEQLASVGAA